MPPAGVRPNYKKLIGILSQTPLPKSEFEMSDNLETLGFYHATVKDLAKIMGMNHSSYYVKVEESRQFRITEFRQKMNALIMFIYGLYFPNEQEPFSGSPSSVMQQVQSQEQTQSITIKTVITISLVISLTISVVSNFIFKFIFK